MEARVWLDTELPDVRDLSLIGPDGQLGVFAPLAPFQEILLGQVERPRYNLGSGPPGRAD